MSEQLSVLDEIAQSIRGIDAKLTALLHAVQGKAVAPGGLGFAPGDLSIKQVAERLRASPATIYRLCDSGKLPSYRVGVGRGTIRVREEDLQKFTEGAKGQPLRVEPPPPPVRLKHLKVS